MNKKISITSVFLLLISVFFRWVPFDDSESKIDDLQNSRKVSYGRVTKITKSNTKISNHSPEEIENDREPLALFTAYLVRLEEEPQIHDGEQSRFELGNLFRKLSGTLLFSQNYKEE